MTTTSTQKSFRIRNTVSGACLGTFLADDERGARDACARDAGYKSAADLAAQIPAADGTDLEVTELSAGWHTLPCGGAVKIEDGLPVRLSDGATADEPGADTDRILAEAIEYTGRRLIVREWQSAQGEPDATARVEIVEEYQIRSTCDDSGARIQAECGILRGTAPTLEEAAEQAAQYVGGYVARGDGTGTLLPDGTWAE